ncbi:MAG: CocE/NonD family hydrolase [bacterium]|nr:CocE/NonD family hydrolase [bacterium]
MFRSSRVVFFVVFLLTALSFSAAVTAQEPTPTTESRYLTMRDGIEIAVDVIYPADFDPAQAYPTLMQATRYWRGYQGLETWQGKPEIGALVANGYIVVMVDARGTGASGGDRLIEWSPDEIADYGEVINWIAAQPWSNGRVGAFGVSYAGTTAELAAVPNAPALVAVSNQYSNFDPLFYLAHPGGVFTEWFVRRWSDYNAALDTNDVCAVFGVLTGGPCDPAQLPTTGVRPADTDTEGTYLASLLAERFSANVYDSVNTITYRGESYGESGQSVDSVSVYNQQEAIEASGVPMFTWVSWLDTATADGALSRYLTFSNPQRVIIGPWSHGGGYHTDPFFDADTPVDPSLEAQFGLLLEFFDSQLKTDAPAPVESSITYYTLNSGEWRTTSVWPPEGVEMQSWYLGAENTLATSMPTDASGADSYTVDFTATTGDATRWHSIMTSGDIIYPDRAAEDEKLLTYTTAPLTEAVEITGSPVVTLHMASTESDGALHVYLEAVAPDGQVTYITEGVLRLIHHPLSSAEPPYAQLGPYRSYEEADAQPLVPGETTEIVVTLYATSVLIEEGSSVRVSIAGHDASVFRRYPAEGTPVLTIERNAVFPSRIDLPVVAQ